MRNRDRRIVEQAKGVLMLRYGTGSYEALGLMAGWSAEAGVTVSVTAHALVDGICKGRAPASAEEAALVRLVEQRLRETVPDAHLEPDVPGGPPPGTAGDQTHPPTAGTAARTEKETHMDQIPPRMPEQRKPVDDLDLEGMSGPAEPAQRERKHPHHHHQGLRGLAGGFSDRRWRYSDALEAARRLSSGGGRPAASSG